MLRNWPYLTSGPSQEGIQMMLQPSIIEPCFNSLYTGGLFHRQMLDFRGVRSTVKILKFGTPQTIAIIVLKIEKFDVTLH